MHTYIIAEAGVNHNGSLDLAFKLIDAAVDSKADAVKFQTFKAERLVIKNAPKAEYQKKTTSVEENQYEMLRKLELSDDDHYRLADYCRNKGIAFLSSAFDLESISFLNKMGLEIFKIPSGEITNLLYLRAIGSLNKRVIISTGMSDIGEIEDALGILTESGTVRDNVTVLHCNSEYPTPFEDVNLRAMLTIKKAFNVKVGYSDHTPGIEVPIAAVALGAEVIEKHFTLDRKMEGPDHKASLEPYELSRMVEAIRNVERSLGNGIKTPSPSESKNKNIGRKSIVARVAIKKGDVFTESNLTVKRPGFGVSPMRWESVLGRISERNYDVDEPLDFING